jgi:hypothetical protein
MADEEQIGRIDRYLEDIIRMCREDPSALQMSIANFKYLLDSMKAYERAPRIFNSRLEEIQPPPARSFQVRAVVNTEQHRFPVIGNLEKEFRRKLKQSELVFIAKTLARALGLKLEREEKRKKDELIRWFDAHWQVIEPKIREIAWPDALRFPREVP